MARLGSSIDIGEELGPAKESDLKPLAPKQAHHSRPSSEPAPEPSEPPNVVLKWDQSRHRSEHHEPSTNSPPIHTKKKPTTRHYLWSLAIIVLVLLGAFQAFMRTADFPGVSKAVESQLLEGLRVDLSQRIASDYQPVSEARKRFMFQEKFSQLSKSPETKLLIRNRQEATKDLFRDEHGLPYLYTPEAYRYALIADHELGNRAAPSFSPTPNDLKTSNAIVRFHQLTSFIRPTNAVEWSAFYLPIGIGLAVTLMVLLIALVISREPFAALLTGIALISSSIFTSTFSAGFPHPSTVGLIATWTAVLLIMLCLSSHRIKPTWNLWICLIALISGIITVVAGSAPISSIIPSTISSLGRGVIGILALFMLITVWICTSRPDQAGPLGLSATLAILSILASASDPSGISTIIGAAIFIGVTGNHLISLGENMVAESDKPNPLVRIALTIFIAAIIAGATIMTSASSPGLVLPGIDDSLLNASRALATSSSSNAVFISDSVSSDPLAYLSARTSALSNESSPLSHHLFALALTTSSENDSKLLLQSLSCPAALAKIETSGKTDLPTIRDATTGITCPDERFLIITDRTLSSLNTMAAEAGIDTVTQTTPSRSPCEVIPTGGITCGNGFDVLDLNATRKGLFPHAMISFIGKTRIVPYNQSRIEDSFVIYRENDKLYSLLVPPRLDQSILVRAVGHDTIPFLQEISTSSNPTHATVYRILP